MPDQPRKPDLQSLGGEVDRLLRQLNPSRAPSRALSATPSPVPGPGTRGAARAGGYGRPGFPSRALPRHAGAAAAGPGVVPVSLPSRPGVWARTLLAALLAAGLTQWPYATCGVPLIGYFAAVAVVLVAGGWAGQATWRRRMAAPHIVAVSVVFIGLALAAFQVLLRVLPTTLSPAWRCMG